MLVELCRLDDEEGQLELTPQLLPMLSGRFPELVAHIEAGSQRKSGAHRIERMMNLWIEGFGNSVDEAAKVVARAANISPESAKVQYYRWRRSDRTKKRHSLRRVTKSPSFCPCGPRTLWAALGRMRRLWKTLPQLSSLTKI